MSKSRTFNPVGQGAFYVEKIENFTAIYDCGSDSNLNGNCTLREIKKQFKQGENIDAIFISHFHNDHINGLDFLLKYCNVKRIFLPQLSDAAKIILLLDYYKNYNPNNKGTFTEKLITNPIKAIHNLQKETHIIFVKENIESAQNDSITEMNNITNSFIISGTEISIVDKWMYFPFNFKHEDRYLKLIRALNTEGITLNNINEIIDRWNSNDFQNKVIKAYEKVPGDLNTNSMVVYSGPYIVKSKSIHQRLKNSCSEFYGCCHSCLNMQAGCIYTGDYDAKGKIKWNQLKKAYSKYWDSIGIWQVPHHGSNYNYNQEISKGNNKTLIICAGSNNKYHHPHSKVLIDIINNNTPVKIVDEFENSIVEVIID